MHVIDTMRVRSWQRVTGRRYAEAGRTVLDATCDAEGNDDIRLLLDDGTTILVDAELDARQPARRRLLLHSIPDPGQRSTFRYSSGLRPALTRDLQRARCESLAGGAGSPAFRQQQGRARPGPLFADPCLGSRGDRNRVFSVAADL
jgi:hypothetical protein